MKRVARFLLTTASTLVLAAAGPFASTAGAATGEWEPKTPIDFVVMAGKGGGADSMARLMQAIAEKYVLSPQPLVPTNVPGASGEEALMHLKHKAGDDHTLMVTLNSFYTTPLRRPGLDVDITAFAPVARMAEDTFLLWVHSESGIDNLEEFLDAAMAAGNSWRMAGTGEGQEDELLTIFLNETYGLDMRFVPFAGGGQVAEELAVRRVHSTVNNPSEQLGFYEAGKTRPIAAFTRERLARFVETPTFFELSDDDLVYFMQRSIVGPPGMSPEAAAFYQDMFRKIYESDEWQRYMQDKSMYAPYIAGDELKAYWIRERAVHDAILRQVGEI